MTGELLLVLARANLAAAAAILVVLALRPFLQRGLGPRAFYRLWLAPPLCAAATLIPYPAEAGLSPAVIAWGAALSPSSITAAAADRGWSTLLLLLWAIGAAGFAAILAVRQTRFARGLGDLRPAIVGHRRVLRASRPGVGPAIVGAAIVLPADFEARFTPEEREAILSHEAAHLARGDVVANAFVAAARSVCWFNPLVHLAAFVCRLDQELACDATVVEARPSLRRTYAEALLKTQLAPGLPPVGCTWPSRAQHPLRERISMLGLSRPTLARRGVALAVSLALPLGGAYAAWAAGAEPALVERPDWIDRPSGEDMARFYPAEAEAQKLSGQVTLECRVARSGDLSGCTVVSETPSDVGFGEATLALAREFRMGPTDRTGSPTTNGVVRVPVLFRIAE